MSDEMMVISDEFAFSVDEVALRSSISESGILSDVLSDGSSLVLEEPEEYSQYSDVGPDTSSDSSSLDAERVQQIVNLVLESDEVNGLIQTFSDTLANLSYTLSQSVPSQEPVEVVSVEDVMQRMSFQAVQAEPTASLMGDGEILVPGSGELTVLEEVVQQLLSYFQEDDNDLLCAIRDNTASIKLQTAARPLMTTPFSSYSVTEGLLFLLVLWLMVINPSIKMLKRGLSWLLR